MPVEITTDRVLVKHPKGSSADILLYGATIVSWKQENKEILFVSSKACLDGSKPVRGGIPVVFPCFGPPSHPSHLKLPQHGFARSEVWQFDKVIMDNNAGVSIRLTLEPNVHTIDRYSKLFKLAYVVTLAEHQLSTDLHVENPSKTESLEFQALLHNYFRVPADKVTITPLKGLSFHDKTETTEEARAKPKIELRDEVTVTQRTDSVYENGSLKYRLAWPDGCLDIRVNNFKDVVIWNPQEDGWKIGDMEPDGWKRYVCVEPGFVRGFVSLEAGQSWIGQQVLSVAGY